MQLMQVAGSSEDGLLKFRNFKKFKSHCQGVVVNDSSFSIESGS